MPPQHSPCHRASVGGREEQIEQLFDIFDETDADVQREALPDLPSPTDTDPEVHAKISDAVAELLRCYADGDTPPVIDRLASLVEQRDYLTIRDEVDEIWTSLLQFHKKKKLRPKPSLTTSFNTIHAIVRDL